MAFPCRVFLHCCRTPSPKSKPVECPADSIHLTSQVSERELHLSLGSSDGQVSLDHFLQLNLYRRRYVTSLSSYQFLIYINMAYPHSPFPPIKTQERSVWPPLPSHLNRATMPPILPHRRLAPPTQPAQAQVRAEVAAAARPRLTQQQARAAR